MTGPQLDGATAAVLDVLLTAWDQKAELHGWEIMHRTRRPGPSVYRALDRLERAGWITATWEVLKGGEQRPRVRYYRITADKVEAARAQRDHSVRAGVRPLLPRFGFGAAS
jgi:DNA-binding PadR family transcriptional regulator